MAIAYRSVLEIGDDAAIVKSLTVTQQPTKTTYLEGEPLNLSGMRVSAVVEPFSGEVTNYVITTPANGQPVPSGTSNIWVKYGNATTNVPITVYGIEEIEITTQPTTTEYLVGDTLDLTGIVVTGYANNRTMSTDITDLCTFSPADGDTLSTSGSQTITVSYKGMTDTTSVDVYVYDTLTVTAMPTKTLYQLNETLDLTGIVVTVLASGSSFSQEVTSQCTFNPPNGTVLSEVKTYTISVTYNGISTTFNVKCKTLPEWDDRGLEYNDWDTIQAYTEFGLLGTVATVGETKSFVVNNKTYNAEIVSINDGTGNAAEWYPKNTVDFISIELYEEMYSYNPTATNVGGFPRSALRGILENTIYPLLPLDLKGVIIAKSHSYNIGQNNTDLGTDSTELWLPTRYEIEGNTSVEAPGETSSNNKKYIIASRKKYLNGEDTIWWLGSLYSYTSDRTNNFWCMSYSYSGYYKASYEGAVPICFRIG